MTLERTDRPKSLSERLREVYPPVDRIDETFADALRRIANSLDANGTAKPRLPGVDLTPDNSLGIMEAIAIVASLDDIVLTSVSAMHANSDMEVRFTLTGKPNVVEGLAKMIAALAQGPNN